MKPVYRATVVMSPTEAGNALGALGSLASQFGGLAGLNFGGGDRLKDEALAILQSRSFTEKFISEHELLPKLFPDRWDAAGKRWIVAADSVPSLGRGFKIFDREVRTVEEDQLTGLISVSIEHHDRKLTAEWANLLVQDLNAFIRRRAIDEAERSLRYLNEELNRSDVLDVRLGIIKVVEQQLQEIMFANVRHEYAFRVIDPAAVPEAKSYVRPQRVLMIVGGFVIGLVLGLLTALTRNAFTHDGVSRVQSA
jgi:uncharacterized protein involved in exopolysaccharide biosynthesis